VPRSLAGVPESERRGGAAVHVQDVGGGGGRGRRRRAKRDDEDGGAKLRGARQGRGGAPGCIAKCFTGPPRRSTSAFA